MFKYFCLLCFLVVSSLGVANAEESVTPSTVCSYLKSEGYIMGNWKPDGAGSNFCVSRNLTIDSGSREGTLLYMVTGEKNIPNRFSVTLNIQVQSSNKKEDKENLIKSVEVLTKKILNTSTPQKILNSIKSGKDVEIKVKDMNLKVETTKYTGGSYLYCKGYQVRVIIEKHK